MKKKKKYLDYEAIKHAVSVVDVLTEHYDLADSLVSIAGGRAYSGACPICKAKRGNPLRITIEDGTSAWLCLAECNSRGNVLDLVAEMEDTDIHGAAILLDEWFDLSWSPTTNGEKKAKKGGKGYLRDIEQKLGELLSAGDDEATIRFVKEKCLESYRNGQAVKKKPA